MNDDATNERQERFWIWLIWLLVITSAMLRALSTRTRLEQEPDRLLLGIAIESEKESRTMFP